eukprot:TRINITY_DN12836_c0_g1_i4.p5 TRINITY_DN12836_c0_g1~~TRINITY_DN12836_c0_g1_i4.p5  ORF type:complete len:103 (+),score=19.77 TRINITY_DN12836_c0_g1_i4:651-959(+)
MAKCVRVVVEVWGTVLTDGHVWVEYTATAGLPLPSPADQLSQTTRPPEVDRRLRELIGRAGQRQTCGCRVLDPDMPIGQDSAQIGRAVQQECRDRSRMPSSA